MTGKNHKGAYRTSQIKGSNYGVSFLLMTESYLIRLNKVIAEPAFRIAWSVTKTFLETFKAERAAKLAGEKVAAVE